MVSSQFVHLFVGSLIHHLFVRLFIHSEFHSFVLQARSCVQSTTTLPNQNLWCDRHTFISSLHQQVQPYIVCNHGNKATEPLPLFLFTALSFNFAVQQYQPLTRPVTAGKS